MYMVNRHAGQLRHTLCNELVLRLSKCVVQAFLHIHHVPEGLKLLPKNPSFAAYRLVIKLAHSLAGVCKKLVKLSTPSTVSVELRRHNNLNADSWPQM